MIVKSPDNFCRFLAFTYYDWNEKTQLAFVFVVTFRRYTHVISRDFVKPKTK